MRNHPAYVTRSGLRFSSRRAHRRWLKRRSLVGACRAVGGDTRSGLEALEQRTLLSAAPVFELSGLLAANGGDGSQGVVINGVSLGDRAGISVGSAGDINGDGYDDVIIGAFRDAPNGADSGASFVVFGQAGGFSDTLQLSALNGSNGFKINGVAAGDFSGRSVAGAGDVNGDGFDDLLIGAFVASPNGAESGQAYVVYGKAGGFASTLELSALNGADGFSIDGLNAGDRLGFSVRGAGDVNGDGIDDFILGASLASPNGAASGTAYVVFGQTGGFGTSLDLGTLNGSNGFVVNGVAADDQLGVSVNAAGDVNGDGIGDVVVGAFLDDPNGADSGAAFVVFGATSGFAASLDPSTLNGTNGFAITGASSLDNAGRSVSSAGDFNGDGFSDLLVGATTADGTVAATGVGYVVLGHGGPFAASIGLSTLTGANGFALNGTATGDRAGISVSPAGDVNGDGLDDLLIGADRADPNGVRSGETFLVLGRTAAMPASLNLSTLAGADGFVLNGINAQDSSGTSVRNAGDVDGDGFDDLLIGAFLADPNGGESGESYLVFGGDFSNAVTHLGSSFADSLVGTVGADVMVAGRGDDVVTGNGGADVLLGGQGDDQIVIADTAFKRVGGGSGSDTLTLAGTGQSLDLTTIADSRLTGIETIDISGGTNTLTLNQQEVLNLSDTSNTLTVVRNINGTVNIGAGWTQTGSQVINGNQQTTFTQGNATLIVVELADLIDPVVTVNPLVTEMRSPQLTGTVVDLDPATTVQVTVNGVGYAATNNGDGTWTLPAGTISPDLTDGVYEVLAVGTDTSGNNGNDQTFNELLVDNAAPVVTVDPLTTNDPTPQLTGTVSDVDAATTISVNVNGTNYATVNNGDGTWTLPAATITPALADGVYEVAVTGVDTLGHIGTDTSNNELAVDTVLPIVTVDPLTTTDTTPQLTGTVNDLDPATTVQVTVNGSAYAATNNGDGTWTLADNTITPALAEGTYELAVSATDTAGNVGLDATVNELVVDTAPVVTVDTLTTSDQRPQLTGTVLDADTAAAVTVTVNGIAYPATNNGDGTWTLADNAILVIDALPDGVYDVSVSVTDAGGNTGNDGTTNELTIDTAAPTVTVDPLSTSDVTPALTGTVSDSGSSIEVTVNGVAHAAVNNGDGTWTLPDNTITVPLAEGVYDVSVTATNQAEVPVVGADATTDELTVDITDPLVTFNSKITGDTTPELTGTVTDADLSAAITVAITGVVGSFTAVNNGDGTWTLPDNTISPALAVGTYDVTVTVVDAAGNLGAVTEPASLEITNAPFTITVDTLATTDPTPQLTGTISDPAAVVVVTVNGTPYAATNNGDGTWTLPDNTITPALPDGVYDVLASGTDSTPVTLDDGTTNELTIDTTAPVVTVNPRATTDTNPQLTGTVDDPAAAVTVTVNGTAYPATNNGDGTWTLADNTITPPLAIGVYEVLASATDGLANTGADASTNELTIVDPANAVVNLSDLFASGGGDGSAGVVFQGVLGFDRSGNSASGAGDINGDGFDDLIIGANGADPAGSQSGTAYVVFGQAGGFPAEFDLSTINGSNGFRLDGLISGDYLGFSVASTGDVNGDGFDDLVVGAPRSDPNGNRSGTAYVIFGQAGPFAAALDLTSLDGTNGYRFEGAAGLDQTGFSVNTAGDVNGDGLDDVLIGTINGDTLGDDAGRSYVVFGSTSAMPALMTAAGLNGANGFAITGADPAGHAGFSVSSAGDMNGDGIDDLRIGAPDTDVAANIDAGKTFIVFGQAGGFGANLDLSTLNGANGFVIEGTAANQNFGFSGSDIGDFNGDGFGDVLIGAPTKSDPTSAGSAYVVFGQASPFAASITLASLDGTNGFAIQGIDTGDYTGFSVSGVGDINGDGFDDMLIGVYGGDPNGSDLAGESYLVFGHGGAFATTLDLSTLPGNGGVMINGATTRDRSGRYVSGAGDINGDGFDDLLVTARSADVGPQADAGETYLVFGRDFTGTVSQTGTALGETLTGSVAVDVIIAGAGGDELVGNGGADVLRGGEGDDVLAVSDTGFVRLAGGNGFDTLRLDGAGIALDLTALSDFVLTGLEQLDIRGAGANSLTLDAREVLRLSDTTNTLLVLSEPDDTVNMGAGWTASGSELINGKSFDVFTQGQAALKVFVDSDTTAPVVTVDALTTADTTPQLTGTVVDDDPATTVEVTVNGVAYAATNNGDGTWTLADNTITPALADGTYDVSVTATDTATNAGSDATLNELVVDATAPVVTVDALITTDTTPQLTGTVVDADPATTVEVTVNGVAYAATNNGDGTWTLADNTITPALADGTYDVSVTATDTATNAGSDATLNELVIEVPLVGDLDGDGFVGIADLNIVLGNWNQAVPPADPRADVDGDNFVGIVDLNAVLGNWNAGTPPVAQASASSPAVESKAVTSQVQVNAQGSTAAATAEPITDKISLLDVVSPVDQQTGQAAPATDRAQAAGAWGWLYDGSRGSRGDRGSRGLRTAFGADGDDGQATDSALDLARPLAERSAISRLR
jgi:Bacterial Ig-like domain/FG-GAP repeat/RTX calcium-binding nonapeptide repeat (4 copies)